MSKRLFRFTERETITGYYEAKLSTLPEFGDTQIAAMVQIKLPFPYPTSKENGITDMVNDFFERVLKETINANDEKFIAYLDGTKHLYGSKTEGLDIFQEHTFTCPKK